MYTNINSLSEDLKTRKYVIEIAESFATSIAELSSNISEMKPDLTPLSNLANAIQKETASREAQKVNIEPLYNQLAIQINQYVSTTKSMHSSIEILHDSVEKLKVLLTEEEKKALSEDVLIGFSHTSMPAGKTIISFRDGFVEDADRTQYSIADTQQYLSQFVNSVLLMSSVAASCTLVGKKTSTIPLPAGKYIRILNHAVSRIEIETTASADIFVIGSLEQDGAPQIS